MSIMKTIALFHSNINLAFLLLIFYSANLKAEIFEIYIFFPVMGKAEGHGENWHGHVTALTVSPEFRRLGLAATLMTWLEDVSEK
jgi:ribosomal protein S18 acetylase RimI-like enzyme